MPSDGKPTLSERCEVAADLVRAGRHDESWALDLERAARIVALWEAPQPEVAELLEKAEVLRRSAKAAYPGHWEYSITAKFADHCDAHAADLVRLAEREATLERVRALVDELREDAKPTGDGDSITRMIENGRSNLLNNCADDLTAALDGKPAKESEATDAHE